MHCRRDDARVAGSNFWSVTEVQPRKTVKLRGLIIIGIDLLYVLKHRLVSLKSILIFFWKKISLSGFLVHGDQKIIPKGLALTRQVVLQVKYFEKK